MQTLRHFGYCLAALVALSACGENKPAPAANTPVASSVAAPTDPALAKLYAQTCKACHTNPGSGAPQAGDVQAWAPRVAQGMDTLLNHTVNGYKGMPPLGTCMDCSTEDFTALIHYMAGIR